MYHLIKKYYKPTWDINYSEQVFQVGTRRPTHGKKQQVKKGIGIDKFEIGIEKFYVELINFMWN